MRPRWFLFSLRGSPVRSIQCLAVVVVSSGALASCGLGGAKPCSTRSDCALGQACGPQGLCVSDATSQAGADGGAGTGGGAGGGAGTGGGAAAAKRVFVTNTAYPSDLAQAGSASDGLAGADALCNLAAQAQNMGGIWVAWLSSSTVAALSRIPEVGPWYVVDSHGQQFLAFNNKANLQTSPQTSVSLDERGNEVAAFAWSVWTGTRANGSPAASTCSDWSTTGGVGVVGLVGSSTSTWTYDHASSCANANHLLCFEK